MPFGENVFCDSLSAYVNGTAAVNRPAATVWGRHTNLYVRTTFTTLNKASFTGTIKIIVDNDLLGIWVNGQMIPATDMQRDGCDGIATMLSYNIPSANLVENQPNVIGVKVRDHDAANDTSNQSFLNIALVLPNGYSADGQGAAATIGKCVCIG